MAKSDEQAFIEFFQRASRDLFGGEGHLGRIFSKEGAIKSSQSTSVGRKQHPYEFDAIQKLMNFNPHHAACIRAKKNSTVGLGFESEADKKRKKAKRQGLPEPDATPEEEIARIDTILDPLCAASWQNTISDACDDFWMVGTGYLEIRREAPDDAAPIVGVHHLPALSTYVFIENESYDRHYEIESTDGGGPVRRFALFGDLEGFIERSRNNSNISIGETEEGLVSEVIEFPLPSPLSRWYGWADWLSCVPSIELAQMMTQKEFDFYLNRGVPEFLMFIFGNLTKEAKQTIKESMQSHIGLGNSHKSAMINLSLDAKAQVEKLALEGKGEGVAYATSGDKLAMDIVSAHGVPPLLAGILIPGKLGATNELVQALQAFQSLVVGPAQRIFMQVLRASLGNEAKAPGLGLTTADMVLNTILDTVNLQNLDTVARMRQSPQEAQEEGRDLSRGVKD